MIADEQLEKLPGLLASMKERIEALDLVQPDVLTALALAEDLLAEVERLRARVHEVADEANRRGAKTESELAKLRSLMAEASRRHGEEMTRLGNHPHTYISGYGQATAAAIIVERDEARAELEQLRYERRLLGACRRHLDEIADPEGRYTVVAVKTAGDLAQRIVDEIGHSVTDEPALGPEFRDEIKRVHQLVGRLADGLQDVSEGICWQGNFAACDNGGCVHRRALLVEARQVHDPIECGCELSTKDAPTAEGSGTPEVDHD